MRRKPQPLTQQTDGGSPGKDTREFFTVSSLVLTVRYLFPFHEYIVLLETADLIKPSTGKTELEMPQKSPLFLDNS